MPHPLPIVNLEKATFECTFGRGCEGICCKNGRPAVIPSEAERIDANLHKILPRLRPEARAMMEKQGYVTRRMQIRGPTIRVVNDWCIFFNQGCVLHQLGAEEGDTHLYKPAECFWFPLHEDAKGRWYVRQWGYKGEDWDLFCLNPKNSKKPASETLQDETDVVVRYVAERAARQKKDPSAK